jgi:hypothetical protein
MLLVAALALFISLGAASTASAVNVVYTTTGVFTSSGTALSNGGISYTPVTSALSINTPSFSSIGHLAALTNPAGDITDTLTITIIQSMPGVGVGNVVGQLIGNVETNASSGELDFITTAVATVTSGGWVVTYNPVNETPINPITGAPVSIEARITAAPTAVPTPASVWGGMGLLGLVGLVKLSRKQLAL